MGTIDFDKFLLSFIEKAKEYHPITAFNIPSCIKKALNDQGLQYKDGTFVKTQRNIAAEAKENGYGKSEDEKMRKRLMAMCQHYIDCYAFDQYNLVGYKEALAWLEKQGEKEYALKSSKDEDVHKFVQYIEKQAKAYELNLPNRSYDIYGFAKDILAWLEKQGEQKSYGQRQECIDCQFNYAGECKGSCILKNTEQKPDEWSEEDEKNWRRAIRATQVVYPVTADWLESIKQRHTWKPSDEQMHMLRRMITALPPGEVHNGLESLYNDLKKLTE